MTRAELTEAMALAICCPDGCEVIKCKGQRFRTGEATAALAAIEAAGFAVVPREATPAMHEAGFEVSTGALLGETMGPGFCAINADIYRAMIAASPVEARDE